MRPATARIIDLPAAVAWRADLRRVGATLALTNGCFDVLHAGHVASLAAARAEGDALLVLLNSDASVRALKGPTRPIHGEMARALVLASLRSVDVVVLFEGTDCAAELAALAPEVYAKSAEYRERQHPGEAAALASCGAQVIWLPRNERYSTSAVVERLAPRDNRDMRDAKDGGAVAGVPSVAEVTCVPCLQEGVP
jgi:rfaE bifunctional protein nucleotidyltransferase chain/domain